MKTTYRLSGMHCQACVNRISESLAKLPQVQDLEVTLQPQRAIVQSTKPLDRREVDSAVARAGNYKVLDAVESGNGAATKQSSAGADEASTSKSAAATYYPLILVVAFLLPATGLLQWRAGEWSGQRAVSDFMGCFFIVFSFFKLLDLNGFAGAYRGYDLIAARSMTYARIYPFLELGLGVAYLIGQGLFWVNIATLVLMTISSIGVIASLRQGKKIQCACLGTIIQLPMSTVTLIEDVGMAVMAAVMLAL